MSERVKYLTDEDILIERLPDDVLSSMEVRDRWFASSAPAGGPEQFFVVEDLLRWLPGQTVRVAFLGGNTALHRDIEDATRQITDACNIKLDFGFDAATGKYRTWSTSDTEYAAEIRISFDMDGYFSLVGTDSIAPIIGNPNGPIGGRPHQRSMNFEGFDIQRPAGWQGTVRHEFLHALAFHHEHQSPTGGCDNQFRWQDDAGYQPTKDQNGRYINDSQGRRPGIYTYLGGFPNFWSKATVDHNLRSLPASGLSTGPFDRASIMLYRFPALFYRTMPSPCAPSGNGQSLSAGDKAGLQHLYPADEPTMATERTLRTNAFKSMLQATDDERLKTTLRAQLHTLSGE